jgi:cytochrome b6-f complex iron-sulfur subunit
MNITRTDFLKSLGFSGAALLTLLTACQQATVTPALPVDFDLDLTARENAPLRIPGGFVVVNGVVVARTIQGLFVAATRTCSHQAEKQVVFDKSKFVCLAHGAEFDLTGRGLNANGNRGLTVYKVEQTGSTIRVRS